MKLAILLYGFEAEKLQLVEIMNKLQNQLNSVNSDHVEVVYFIDSDGKSIEEMKEWLVEQTVAQKYVFINIETEITDNFVSTRLKAVRKRSKTSDLLDLGIFNK